MILWDYFKEELLILYLSCKNTNNSIIVIKAKNANDSNRNFQLEYISTIAIIKNVQKRYPDTFLS